MKSIFNKTGLSSCMAIAAMCLTLFNACKEEVVDVGQLDESSYHISSESIGLLVGEDGKSNSSLLEFKEQKTYTLTVQLTKPATQDITNTLAINEEVLIKYNEANGTSYRLFPKELVTLPNSGSFEIKSDSKVSSEISVQVETSADLDGTETYVVPLSSNLSGAQGSVNFLLFVRDNSKLPTPDKSTGIKIVSCIEVNDTNPLNNLSLTLQNSGKPLVDMVILFSSNINYNAQTGKVIVTHNPNITHILENKEKYLKPLKDKGMKVILSILGNHDRSGVANLGPAAAKQFAQELKATCEAYDLDGVFFDDEYSSYQTPVPPGFVTPSRQAAARLCYETKQAMPDKLVIVYVYSRTDNFGGTNAIPEAQAGEYVDYALHDYLGSAELDARYPGLPKSRWGMRSGEYAQGRYPSATQLRSIRTGGYGAHMIFAFDPNRSNWSTGTTSARQLPALQNIAVELFQDVLVFDETHKYAKDW